MSQNLPAVVNLGSRPKMKLPDDLIKQLATNGLSLREMREELKKQGIKVSRMTISRKLQGVLV
jgi:hypothetical protein